MGNSGWRLQTKGINLSMSMSMSMSVKSSINKKIIKVKVIQMEVNMRESIICPFPPTRILKFPQNTLSKINF